MPAASRSPLGGDDVPTAAVSFHTTHWTVLIAAQQERTSDGEALARAISRLLADRCLRAERAAAGRRVAAAGLGILEAVLVRLAPWLDPLAPMAGIGDRPQCLRA